MLMINKIIFSNYTAVDKHTFRPLRLYFFIELSAAFVRTHSSAHRGPRSIRHFHAPSEKISRQERCLHNNNNNKLKHNILKSGTEAFCWFIFILFAKMWLRYAWRSRQRVEYAPRASSENFMQYFQCERTYSAAPQHCCVLAKKLYSSHRNCDTKINRQISRLQPFLNDASSKQKYVYALICVCYFLVELNFHNHGNISNKFLK